MLRPFQMDPRLAVRCPRNGTADLGAQRYQFPPQLIPRVEEEWRWWSEPRELWSGSARYRGRVQLAVQLGQELVLKRAPVGID